VSESYVFYPERRIGLIFNLIAASILLVIAGWGIWQAFQAQGGFDFILYALAALIALLLFPYMLYRFMALRAARYVIERDGIHLLWGIRSEEVPMDEVLWIRRANELAVLPMTPIFWLPGTIIGTRHNRDIGDIEYFATIKSNLVIIAIEGKAYAVSPAEADEFVLTFKRLMELGSLSPIAPRSVYPTFFIARVWTEPYARYLLLAGFVLNILLFVWVSLQAPNYDEIRLGFATSGEPVPSIRLLLLPIISSFLFALDSFIGLFFFRREIVSEGSTPRSNISLREAALTSGYQDPLTSFIEIEQPTESPSLESPQHETLLVPNRVFADLLWSSSLLTTILFGLAIFFILNTGG